MTESTVPIVSQERLFYAYFARPGSSFIVWEAFTGYAVETNGEPGFSLAAVEEFRTIFMLSAMFVRHTAHDCRQETLCLANYLRQGYEAGRPLSPFVLYAINPYERICDGDRVFRVEDLHTVVDRLLAGLDEIEPAIEDTRVFSRQLSQQHDNEPSSERLHKPRKIKEPVQ